jgi:hypothetical protein
VPNGTLAYDAFTRLQEALMGNPEVFLLYGVEPLDAVKAKTTVRG